MLLVTSLTHAEAFGPEGCAAREFKRHTGALP